MFGGHRPELCDGPFRIRARVGPHHLKAFGNLLLGAGVGKSEANPAFNGLAVGGCGARRRQDHADDRLAVTSPQQPGHEHHSHYGADTPEHEHTSRGSGQVSTALTRRSRGL